MNGYASRRRCRELGITSTDLLRFDRVELTRRFGKNGPRFLLLARGHDPRPVVSDGERQSVSIEDTFPEELLARDDLCTAEESLDGLRSLIRSCVPEGRDRRSRER